MQELTPWVHSKIGFDESGTFAAQGAWSGKSSGNSNPTEEVLFVFGTLCRLMAVGPFDPILDFLTAFDTPFVLLVRRSDENRRLHGYTPSAHPPRAARKLPAASSDRLYMVIGRLPAASSDGLCMVNAFTQREPRNVQESRVLAN